METSYCTLGKTTAHYGKLLHTKANYHTIYKAAEHNLTVIKILHKTNLM